MNHQAKAENAYRTVLKHFYVPDARLFREHSPAQDDDRRYSYLWPYIGMLAATNAMLGLFDTAEPYLPRLRGLLGGLDRYWRAPAYESYVVSDGGGQRYYDDNAWAGIELLAAYEILKARWLLDRAQALFDFVMTGWSDDLDGGLFWREGDRTTKNTCANGPAAVLGLELYRVTGDRSYYDRALRIFDWINAHLRAPHGLYWDSISLAGQVGERLFTYNSGIMLQAYALLLQITRSPQYYLDAVDLAQASLGYFGAGEESPRSFPHTPWFNAVLFRGYLALRAIGGDASFAGAVLDSLDYAWDHARDANGLVSADWSGRRPARAYARLLDQASVAEIFALAAALEANGTARSQELSGASRPGRQVPDWVEIGWQAGPGESALSPLGTSGITWHDAAGGAFDSDRHGAFTVQGPAYAVYADLGGPSGPLGFPVTGALPAWPSRSGTRGVVQRFEGSQPYRAPVVARIGGARCGAAIYSSERHGAHPVLYEMGVCYESFGGTGGPLGFPTSARSRAAPSPRGTTGYYQRFEYGSIYWCEPWGSRPVLDEIAARYESLGGTTSRLGFPTSDVMGDRRAGAPGGALRQRFEGGWVRWQPGQAAQALYD